MDRTADRRWHSRPSAPKPPAPTAFLQGRRKGTIEAIRLGRLAPTAIPSAPLEADAVNASARPVFYALRLGDYEAPRLRLPPVEDGADHWAGGEQDRAFLHRIALATCPAYTATARQYAAIGALRRFSTRRVGKKTCITGPPRTAPTYAGTAARLFHRQRWRIGGSPIARSEPCATSGRRAS